MSPIVRHLLIYFFLPFLQVFLPRKICTQVSCNNSFRNEVDIRTRVLNVFLFSYLQHFGFLTYQIGGISPLLMCHKMSTFVHLVDPFTLRFVDIPSEKYWKFKFEACESFLFVSTVATHLSTSIVVSILILSNLSFYHFHNYNFHIYQFHIYHFHIYHFHIYHL